MRRANWRRPAPRWPSASASHSTAWIRRERKAAKADASGRGDIIDGCPEKTTMSNDNDKPGRPGPAPQPPVQHPHEVLYPGGEAKKRKLAVHEDAHTVVTDEVGCTVVWTNISVRNKRFRITHATQPMAFLARDARSVARDKVTIFVAGLVAEKEIDPTVQLVSEQMTHEKLAGAGSDEPDVIMTAHALRGAGIAAMDEILAAEDRARQILRRGEISTKRSSISSWNLSSSKARCSTRRSARYRSTAARRAADRHRDYWLTPCASFRRPRRQTATADVRRGRSGRWPPCG